MSKIIIEVIKLPVSIKYARDKTYQNPIYPWKKIKMKFILLDSSSRSCDENVVCSSKEKYSDFKQSLWPAAVVCISFSLNRTKKRNQNSQSQIEIMAFFLQN